MNSSKPPSALALASEEIRNDLDDVYEDLTRPRKQTDGARWAACVRRVAGLERRWRENKWISEGGFISALVLRAYEEGKTIGPRSTTASLLLMLTTDIEGRQQRSTWGRALQEVLDGHTDVEAAAEMGVKGTLAAAQKRQRAAKSEAARRSEQLKRLQESDPRVRTAKPRRTPPHSQ